MERHRLLAWTLIALLAGLHLALGQQTDDQGKDASASYDGQGTTGSEVGDTSQDVVSTVAEGSSISDTPNSELPHQTGNGHPPSSEAQLKLRLVRIESGQGSPPEPWEPQGKPQDPVQDQQHHEQQQTQDGSIPGANAMNSASTASDTTQQSGDDTSTATVATNATAAVDDAKIATVPAVNFTQKLVESEKKLFRSFFKRDTLKGLDELANLSRLLDIAMPDAVKKRQLLPQHRIAVEEPSKQDKELAVAGSEVAAKGTFTLGALEAAGVLGAVLPRSSLGAIQKLHIAAKAGNQQAHLALADRYFQGASVPQNLTLAMTYARAAATMVLKDVELDNRYSAPLAPMDLKERWIDGSYISAEDVENAPHVVQMEEDMALRGNMDAQRRVAYRRLAGRGMDADPEAAFHDFQVQAAQGDAYALFNLGYMHLKGLYVAKNDTKAMGYFEKAGEKGMGAGWNGLGVLHWNGQNITQNLTAAYEAFLKGAAANNSDSLYNLGLMHHWAIGVEKNETLALDYYEKADLFGHWRVAHSLATIYDTGHGGPRDNIKAEKYYRKFFKDRSGWQKENAAAAKAIDAGDTWGALLQYLIIAEQGSDAASSNAAWLLRYGQAYTGPGFLDLAYSLYLRAARQGSASSMVELGHMIFDAEKLNLSRASNVTEAVSWYGKAAELNNTEGLLYTGWAYQLGMGVEQNRTKAHELYTQAFNVTKKLKGRWLAPYLALTALRLDAWLEPMFGPDATYRAATWLRSFTEPPTHQQGHQHQDLNPDQATHSSEQASGDGSQGLNEALPVATPGSGSESSESKISSVPSTWSTQEAIGQSLSRLISSVTGDVDLEDLTITILLGALVIVLYMRKRIISARAQVAAANSQEVSQAGQQ